MSKLNFAIDSDPWQGGNNNNKEVVEAIFPNTEIDSSFRGFGITDFEVYTELTVTELHDEFNRLYANDKIRGAQIY